MSETINRAPTCAAHPGKPATGACAACLRDARERAEALEATLAHMRGELAGDRESRRLLARQCDLAREAEAERDAAQRRLAEVGTERDWMRDVACGEAVSDFAESFAGVRAVADLRAERDAARREAAEAQAREAVLREALRQIEDGAPELTPEEYGCAEYGDLERDILEFGRVARKALAEPTDRAALDALLAAERERCARIAESETELTEPVPAEVTEMLARIARTAARAWVAGSRLARRIRDVKEEA